MSDEPTNNIASTWRLCAKCETIELRDDLPGFLMAPDENGEAHHVYTKRNTWMTTEFHGQDEFPKLPGLLKSSKHCTLCEFFQKIVSSDRALEVFEREIHDRPLDSSLPIEYRVSFVWGSTYTNEHQYFVLEVSFPDTHLRLRFFCTIEAADECKDLADWLGLSQRTHELYTNKETVDWMISKLNNCFEKHDCGADLLESGYLPERLLDVREDMPKLVFGADIRLSSRTNPRYLALSYCWGSKEDATRQLKLTQHSTQRLQSGISEKDLSAVHRDAVHVAKALSIPYIWIDALCILQDDRDDWERQCQQMDKIYGCAYASILAAASTSSRESFLRRPRGLQTVIPFRSVRQPSRNGLLQIELRKVTSQVEFEEENDFLHDDLACSRLSARGWAYQERILPTRRIVFGEWNVHYLCSNSYQTLHMPGNCGYWDITMDKIKQFLSNGRHRDAWNEVFRTTRYRDTSFTYPEDILPALSGLARVFQEYDLGSYLAGLWERNLFLDLAWQQYLGMTRPKKTPFLGTFGSGSYILPSWSLLNKGSVEMAVENRSDLIGHRSEVKSCDGHVDLIGTDPLGAIKNAQLEIQSHSFQNHTQVHQTITIRQRESTTWKNIWNVMIGWNGRHFHCSVCLDYNLQESDISQDTSMWRWVLLGSVTVEWEVYTRSTRSDSKDSSISPAERQEVRGDSVSVTSDISEGDIGEDGQESRSSFSSTRVAYQSRQSAHSYDSTSEEGLYSDHDEGGHQYELDRSNDQQAQPFTDARGTGVIEDAGIDKDGEPKRHPYGLLLFQVPNQQEWYRVGIFSPEPGDFKQVQVFYPGLELITLDVFKDMSQIETMTVL